MLCQHKCPVTTSHVYRGYSANISLCGTFGELFYIYTNILHPKYLSCLLCLLYISVGGDLMFCTGLCPRRGSRGSGRFQLFEKIMFLVFSILSQQGVQNGGGCPPAVVNPP